MRHFLRLADLSPSEVTHLVAQGLRLKKHPATASRALFGKQLIMLFEAPSLRTRLSFEVGMTQLGGHAIYYNLGESTLGKKESIKEFSRVVSRYADVIMARVYEQRLADELARYADVPIINGMTNLEHPCQVLSDLMTIQEKKKTFDLKLAYVGDGYNNVTHSLLLGAALVGMDISVACPRGTAYEPNAAIITAAKKIAKKTGAEIEITIDPKKAAADADIIYTDSWMSYHIPKSKEAQRTKIFGPYQVNKKLFSLAKKDALFMHDLPATRGREVTDDVMDSPRSIIIDQAENRMHAQKALLVWLQQHR